MPDIYISEDKKNKKVSAKPKTSKPKAPKKEERLKILKREIERKNVKTKVLFSSYCSYPKHVDFESREQDEEIVLFLRKHPITNLRWIFIGVLMIFAPLMLKVLPFLSFMPSNFQFIAILGWYLITSAFLLENFFTWFFDANIVTDERIVDIDFKNLIYKQVSDTNIDKIQDVTYKMGGAARAVFNYGDVLIQTAGEVPNFEFLGVPNPDKVAKVLQELRIEEEVEKLEGRVR